jgi:hypothetical protein
VHHVDCGYHVVGMKAVDAPDIARSAQLQTPAPAAGGARQERPRMTKLMSHNSFGHLFRVTTWGESHGPAIGCVVDGCRRAPLAEADIQPGSTSASPASRASSPSAASPIR